MREKKNENRQEEEAQEEGRKKTFWALDVVCMGEADQKNWAERIIRLEGVELWKMNIRLLRKIGAGKRKREELKGKRGEKGS